MNNVPRGDRVCDPRFWGGCAGRSTLREKNDRKHDYTYPNGRRAHNRTDHAGGLCATLVNGASSDCRGVEASTGLDQRGQHILTHHSERWRFDNSHGIPLHVPAWL